MSVSAKNAIAWHSARKVHGSFAGAARGSGSEINAARPGRIAKVDAPKVRPLIESTVQVALAAALVALMQKRPRNPSRQNLELRG
jgi:hypothetical protein